MTDCACGCGRLVPPRRGHNGNPRRYATDGCKRRVYRRNAAYRAKANARKRQHCKAIKGRRCIWCGRTDDQLRFATNTACAQCSRQRSPSRYPCGRCGGPFYNARTIPHFVLGCLLASRSINGDCRQGLLNEADTPLPNDPILSVRCPYCRARPHKRCRRRDGASSGQETYNIHKARVVLARKKR